MKNFFKNSIAGLLICLSSHTAFSQQTTANEAVQSYTSPFGYGSNLGTYWNGWDDKPLSLAISKAGANTMRPTLPDYFIEQYGVNIRLAEFQYYANTLGMRDHTLFVGEPSEAHRDKTIYPGTTVQSKIFANLYQPIWTSAGAVNPNNYYANYIYKLVQTYGPYVKFWEVVNEPDLGGHNPPQWLTSAPQPSELPNLRAPFYHYLRMMRITWEVVKKYNPDDFVTTGGIGYPNFLDAMLRYTDNPNGGTVTAEYPKKGGAYFDVVNYHEYPTYDLRYWDNSIGGFRYTRNSDFAASAIIKAKNEMEAVLTKYGYNGATYPQKHFIITEANISRRTIEWRYGSDEMQRNFTIKSLVLAQKNNIKQFHIFAAGEKINAPAPGSPVYGYDEYHLMGLYENLSRDAPGSEKFTQQGIGFKTTSALLQGYRYDATRTAALNLPANVEGGAFSKDGVYVYALWAKNPTDMSETFSVPYSFPTSLGFPSVDRFEWDYGVTNKNTQQSSTGITLNTAPSFFKSVGTSVVTKQSQTITFPAITAKTYGQTFALSATASSGLPVSFRVVTGPATVSGNTITITGTGTVTVEASQSGNDTYIVAPVVTQSFTVIKAQAVISFAALATKVAGSAPFELVATSNNTATPVTFTSSNPAVVSVSNATGKWLATVVAAGTANITAAQAASENYLAAVDVVRAQVVEASSATTTPVYGVEGRIKVVSVTPAENTGMDYTPWLNDDLNSLVQSSWLSSNNKYVDVTLKLEQKSSITKVSLYDHSGSFTTNPAEVYAVNGTQRTLIGKFTGEAYMAWVDMLVNNVDADAIVVRKYGNNIPQKVQVFGKPLSTSPAETVKAQAVISFAALATKTAGSAPFELVATSNNTATPVTFTSSNPAVVSVSNATGKWLATVVAAGTANITAAQAASENYLAAADVVRAQVVEASSATTTPVYGVEGRIKVVSVTPAENTGMDYTPWLNDDLNSLVQSSWLSSNNKYVDVTLKLEQKSSITKVSLYDHSGSFTTNPAEVYAVNGTQRTLIGKFTGEAYMAWVDMLVNNVDADAIVVRKYGNNIPQKVQVFGKPLSASPAETVKAQAVISFAALATKTAGSAPFELVATSNNTATPVTFISSNPAVVSVSNATGKWLATVVAAGTANITAAQAASENYLAAVDVVRAQVVEASSATTTPVYGVEGRIKVVSVTPAENTGMDYTPWLNDDLNSLIKSSWRSSNQQYVDVTLELEQKSSITRISLYDLEGSFTTNPAEVYAVNGTQRTLIATFTGEAYEKWVDFQINGVIAESIIIRKYGNNIPQKVQVFGKPLLSTSITMSAATGYREMFTNKAETTMLTGVSWSVYPNPTPDLVQVALNAEITGEVNIQVVDISGKVVTQLTLQKSVQQVTKEISLASLPAGLYFIQLKANGKNETKKVLKK